MKLNWHTGKPKFADIYIIAYEFNEYAGNYEIANWDGEAWDHAHPENIVAFIRASDFFGQANIEWPIPRPPKPDYPPIEGGWTEV